jgi:CP4-57 regulatory protein AlpA
LALAFEPLDTFDCEVIVQTGIKKAKLYELQRNRLFPMRIQITAHALGWVETRSRAGSPGGLRQAVHSSPDERSLEGAFRLKSSETLANMTPVVL